MKKKITVGMALAVVAALLLAGAALAAGLNLFAHFGEDDARIREIAPAATLEAEVPQTVESHIGTTVAAIDSAYYDGRSLLVAYSIENGSRVEKFEPTEEQLAQMVKTDYVPFVVDPNEDAQRLWAEFRAALESGTPYGVATYSVYPSDHTETDDGIDLPPDMQTREGAEGGREYVLREYESPLPEEARNRDSLTIQIRLYEGAYFLYFDGKDCYEIPHTQTPAGAMTATVARADAETRNFAGEGVYDGVKIRVEAEASAVRGSITVRAEADVFAEPAEDSWYEIVVRDPRGGTLRTERCGAIDLRTLEAGLTGTGILPDELTAYVLVASEGEWDEDAAIAELTPISLTPVP